MHSDRVGPIWRARGKHSHRGILFIASRMHLEDRALRLMEPRKDPDVLSRFNAVKSPDKIRMDLQPRIGSTLPSLVRSAGTFLESGAHITDRGEVKALWNIHKGLQERGGGINRSNLPINFIKPAAPLRQGGSSSRQPGMWKPSVTRRLTQKLYGYQAGLAIQLQRISYPLISSYLQRDLPDFAFIFPLASLCFPRLLVTWRPLGFDRIWSV